VNGSAANGVPFTPLCGFIKVNMFTSGGAEGPAETNGGIKGEAENVGGAGGFFLVTPTLSKWLCLVGGDCFSCGPVAVPGS